MAMVEMVVQNLALIDIIEGCKDEKGDGSLQVQCAKYYPDDPLSST
jgi:hypothetical protein